MTEEQKWRVRRLGMVALTFALAVSGSAAQVPGTLFQSTDDEGVEDLDLPVVHILPPSPGKKGRWELEALVLDQAAVSVRFLLDGKELGVKHRPPFVMPITIAPGASHELRVEALDERGQVMGFHFRQLRGPESPLRVGIESLVPTQSGLRVEASLTVPEAAALERFEVYLNEAKVSELDAAPTSGERVVLDVPRTQSSPRDWVRVLAVLTDGRQTEDVALVGGRGIQERLDVRLVQLQVLVTDKRGEPIRDLRAEDFEITTGGENAPVERLFLADDVALLLGLSVDSSGSMVPIWPETQKAALEFLDSTLAEEDRAFLLDFDSDLRLLEEPTGDRVALTEAFDGVEPEGGTALYDSIIYSLVQFDQEAGRRGLVVLTDGFDSSSRSAPENTVELGQKLGVPVYVIVLPQRGMAPAMHGTSPPVGGTAYNSNPSRRGAAAGIESLHLVTGPTGGRLFRLGSFDQLGDAFDRIEAELRSQYVLLYYASEVPSVGSMPEVEVVGRKGLKVKAVVPLDRVQ